MSWNFENANLPILDGNSSWFGCGSNNDGSIMAVTSLSLSGSNLSENVRGKKRFPPSFLSLNRSNISDVEEALWVIRIYISKDYGNSWNKVYTYKEKTLEPLIPYSLSINSSGKYIVVPFSNIVVISTDGGVNWRSQKLSNQLVRPMQIFSNSIGNTTSNIYLSAVTVLNDILYIIVLKSSDDGNTYTEVKRIETTEVECEITSALKSSEVYLLGYAGLYFSPDNGDTWSFLPQNYITDTLKTSSIKTNNNGDKLVSSTYYGVNLFTQHVGDFNLTTNTNGLVIPSRGFMGPTITGNGKFLFAPTYSQDGSILEIYLDSSGTGLEYNKICDVEDTSFAYNMCVNNSNEEEGLICIITTDSTVYIGKKVNV